MPPNGFINGVVVGTQKFEPLIYTRTTAVLSGDANDPPNYYEDWDITLPEGVKAVQILYCSARRVSGTGDTPKITVNVYDNADRNNSAYPSERLSILGGSFSAADVPEDGTWTPKGGPSAEVSGEALPIFLRKVQTDGTLYMRAINAKAGSSPDDDAAFEVVLALIDLGIDEGINI